VATGTWQLEPCVYAEVRALAAALALDEVTAAVLVRRGYGSPAAAQRFLDGALPGHDPFALGDMRDAVDAVSAAVAARARVCVHGDYDADGICATALAVLVLRELEADVTWHLPSRFEEGYGVARETLERLAGEGVDLVLTVDCGVTAVEEVGHARALGLEVVITDPTAATTRSASCAAPASSGSSGRRCSARARRRWPATWTWSRSPPSPTWFRSWTRTEGSRSPVCARWRGRRSRGCAS
jgi:DHH family